MKTHWLIMCLALGCSRVGQIPAEIGGEAAKKIAKKVQERAKATAPAMVLSKLIGLPSEASKRLSEITPEIEQALERVGEAPAEITAWIETLPTKARREAERLVKALKADLSKTGQQALDELYARVLGADWRAEPGDPLFRLLQGAVKARTSVQTHLENSIDPSLIARLNETVCSYKFMVEGEYHRDTGWGGNVGAQLGPNAAGFEFGIYKNDSEHRRWRALSPLALVAYDLCMAAVEARRRGQADDEVRYLSELVVAESLWRKQAGMPTMWEAPAGAAESAEVVAQREVALRLATVAAAIEALTQELKVPRAVIIRHHQPAERRARPKASKMPGVSSKVPALECEELKRRCEDIDKGK